MDVLQSRKAFDEKGERVRFDGKGKVSESS
ncbi:hypothetical protein CCACVL1_24832 [Corchorus capsularis]|uniref:Uncharacterized protein n=1 Tax=Corchorus capsularis TaxID=210143 RepID=A0A1R3GN42_COCAP|nr:hypothetical protein CCACVL1_24832 [Corchorus capsularis]